MPEAITNDDWILFLRNTSMLPNIDEQIEIKNKQVTIFLRYYHILYKQVFRIYLWHFF